MSSDDAEDVTVRLAFQRFDADRTGFIDREELRELAEELELPFEDDDALEDAMATLDRDGSGLIELVRRVSVSAELCS